MQLGRPTLLTSCSATLMAEKLILWIVVMAAQHCSRLAKLRPVDFWYGSDKNGTPTNFIRAVPKIERNVNGPYTCENCATKTLRPNFGTNLRYRTGSVSRVTRV